MCPACLATAALAAGGATSVGKVVSLFVKLFRGRGVPGRGVAQLKAKEN